ncbi:hypothetical protein Thermus77412_13400 [Thermus antranikianii]
MHHPDPVLPVFPLGSPGGFPIPLRVVGIQGGVLKGLPPFSPQAGEGEIAGYGVDKGCGLAPLGVVAPGLVV